MSGLAGNEQAVDDVVSDGSTTPTVSSLQDRETESRSRGRGSRGRKKPVDLNAARRGIFERIQQLAFVKAEENEFLEEDLRELQVILDKTLRWSQKRARLQGRIRDIEGENLDGRGKTLQEEASKLETEIRLKEEELWSLKARHRRILAELAESENSVEAKLSSYKSALSILDKEVGGFLRKPPKSRHVPLSPSPFLTLPPSRRTLEMAQEYWQDEHTRLAERCDEVDRDRAALDEGAVLWDDIITKLVQCEDSLQGQLRRTDIDPSGVLSEMEGTINYLETKLEVATSRNWNLLVCAIGAELEAFKQGKTLLAEMVSVGRKGKEKKPDLVETSPSSNTRTKAEESSPTRECNRSPPRLSALSPPKFLDLHDEDPDPELMISHQDEEQLMIARYDEDQGQLKSAR
jgi:hypothetical protein